MEEIKEANEEYNESSIEESKERASSRRTISQREMTLNIDKNISRLAEQILSSMQA